MTRGVSTISGLETIEKSTYAQFYLFFLQKYVEFFVINLSAF